MRREVTLSGDLGGWPLWIEEREGEDELCGATTPDDWPMLSNALKRDLVQWNDSYLDPPAKRRWLRRREFHAFESDARILVERVQAELGESYAVRWSR